MPKMGVLSLDYGSQTGSRQKMTDRRDIPKIFREIAGGPPVSKMAPLF